LSASTVSILELIAWGLDEYPYRNHGEFAIKLQCAEQTLAARSCYESCNALLEKETAHIQRMLDVHAQRTELRQEYEGLDWMLGVVDLRRLLAFQRRLVFDIEPRTLHIPQQDDWAALLSLSLGSARNTDHSINLDKSDGERSEFRLQSSNPDLQLRPILGTKSAGLFPFTLYGGSPFFEVAEYRGRWFLRDGYHRAYGLLQAGVSHVPAVVIRARTMDEVGATQPWFFHEDQLFSKRPPRVVDFLDEALIHRYQRPRFIKTIRILIEESLQPFEATDEVQGDDI
jgi:hypothetical protein